MSSEKNNNKKGKISGNVVNEIKKNGVKMKPSYYFIIYSFIWFGLGAILFAVSLFLIAFGLHYLNEYEFLGLLLNGHISGWLLAPVIAIVISVLLIYFSSRFYRKGRICCRHEEWMLLLAIGVVALIGIFLLARSDLFKGKRESIEHHDLTQNFIISAKRFWSNPSEGRLSGEVIGTDQKEKHILIKNQDGLRKIYTGDCDCEVNHNNAKEGDVLKLIGVFNNNIFKVKEVWYWE